MFRPRFASLAVLALGLTPLLTAAEYPPLPKAVSSFGAVACDGYAYVYGGHAGTPHSYSTQTSLGTLHRLPLAGGAWEELPGGPGLIGLNLATAGGKVYRVGGMAARNAPGEKSDLVSVADVGVFDPKAKAWSAGVPLPVGRSSHDVVGVGSKLVVVGGWTMGGKSEWAETALVLDTAAKAPKWEAIPQPFKRRALTAAAVGGKVYVLGGLTESGESVRTVDVLDLATGSWSKGPEFPGGGQTGFSPAACTLDGSLYLNTREKAVWRLNAAGDGWDRVGTTAESRYVHRLIPAGSGKLLAVAGASPKGPHASVEEVKLDGKPAAAADNPKVQKFCPVMTTDEIDPAASDKVTYKGITIYVCCGDCARKFRTDPAAYLDPKLIPALAGMELPKREIEQVFCPVYKERKVSAKDPFVTYKGVKVYVYNALAKTRFEKDPDRYADVKILPQLKNAK